MKEIVTETLINAPADKVWKILTDFNHYKEWNPFITQAEGESMEGSKLNITISLPDKPHHFKPIIKMTVVNRYLEWQGKLPFPGLFKGNHYFQIERVQPGQVKLIHGERFTGLLSGIIMDKIGKETKVGFQKMNEALKKLAEN